MNLVDSSGWLEYLADSLIYITAKQNNAIVWTQDADFKSLDNVKYFKK